MGKQVHWFYQSTEGSQGPVPLEFLKSRLEQGQIPPHTLVWMEGFEHERLHLSDALKTHDAPLYTLFDLFQSVKRKKSETLPTATPSSSESNVTFWVTLTRPALPLLGLSLAVFLYFQQSDTMPPPTPKPSVGPSPILLAPAPQKPTNPLPAVQARPLTRLPEVPTPVKARPPEPVREPDPPRQDLAQEVDPREYDTAPIYQRDIRALENQYSGVHPALADEHDPYEADRLPASQGRAPKRPRRVIYPNEDPQDDTLDEPNDPYARR